MQVLNPCASGKRGTLTVYYGYAVGVGKTYGMLVEAKKRATMGEDVVLGYIEAHERETIRTMAEPFESVSSRILSYRNVSFSEPDTDAIIRRRPAIVLIDELAHTNAVGSDREKRYQDVEQILAAGIHVITSMNAQHLASLAPRVESELGIKVPEQIPDSVLCRAERIVHVDPWVWTLLRRLKNGEIYSSPERIEIALQNFFTTPNLKYLKQCASSWLKENYFPPRA